MKLPTRSQITEAVITFGALFLGLAILYGSISWIGFEWRNPKANRMSFYRDFTSVMTWRRLAEYQR